MTRTYDSMQEMGWLADNGKTLRADAIAEVSITVHRSDTIDEKAQPERTYIASLLFKAVRTGDTVAIYERPFSSLEELTDLFGIDELEEVWEVLE